jgi:flagellar protein FliL
MAMGKKKDKDEKSEDEDRGARGGGMKRIILLVVPALAVGGGLFFFLGGSGEETGPTTTLAPIEGEVIAIDTLTVNLVGEQGRYARLGFAVVLDSTAAASAVDSKIPLLQDAALGIMVGYDAETLQSIEGQKQLRQDLSDASVALFPDGEVLRAVLTELIVQ